LSFALRYLVFEASPAFEDRGGRMPIGALDTLLAIKILGLVPGLKASDQRVATVLLEHFNRRTGQCDPGLTRISELLGISVRTVIRSNTRLEASGLFRKVRHGGYGNRNSYQPVWSSFTEHQALWQAKMQYKSKSRVPDVSPASRHACHVQHDSAVTQTCSTNTSQPTYSSGLPKKRLSGKSSSAAARDEAERRWSSAITDQFRDTPGTHAQVIQAITAVISEAATDAELQRPGAGFDHIINELKLA
jgi:hypothetical protein